MFAKAVELASRFTYPVVISSRRWNGEIGAGAAAFVVVNSDGWIVTAAHIFSTGVQAGIDAPKVDALNGEVAAVRADASLRPSVANRAIQRLHAKADRGWITNHSYWWARDTVAVVDLKIFGEADLAVGRLDPVPADMVATLPMFKNPTHDVPVGTSLCRLGFPFGEVSATFDETTNTFSVAGSRPPLFPIDGIYTRKAVRPAAAGPQYFLETSSPGLMGQSGGPVFDVEGRIWGIQSHTSHLPLGFRDEIEVGGKKMTVPPQFLNLGRAVHVETITTLLDSLGVRYNLSP